MHADRWEVVSEYQRLSAAIDGERYAASFWWG